MAKMINFDFVRSLVKRDLWKYFTNPTGYVFITLFIFLSAAAAFWQDRFFFDNLATLGQLNRLFPYLLLFFIPALTMSVWSEERKQGTDELLLTLPATELEVVLGKYLSTLGIYVASLILSLSHAAVLFWLGSPDLGLLLSNYVGYFLLGAALIAVGMVASYLTRNPTIAFILGALFCSLFVITNWTDFLAPLSVFSAFEDFSTGVVSLSGLLYFFTLTAVMLYLNVLFVQQRHWPREAAGYPMWGHQLVRVFAIAVAAVSFNVIVARGTVRLDWTAEGLHSLSPETHELLSELDPERPVFIRAFVSPDAPEQYVQTRENLLGVLSEIDSIGGPVVQVLIEETAMYTESARQAREQFGITPRQVPNVESARAGFTDLFLGVAVTCGAEEEVLPFLDPGLAPEYELTRSIRVVARTGRKKVGVLTTEAKLFGGFDFQTMSSNPPWPVVDELKKQYEVVQVAPDAPIAGDVDALVVALPSSLPQEHMDNLADYLEAGRPALLLVDPLPVVNIGLAPSEESGANRNPLMGNQGPPPQPKGDIRSLLAGIGVDWNPAAVVWDSYNPHPDLAHLAPEFVFVGPGNGNPQAFNPEQSVSASLQELVLLFPGALSPVGDAGEAFQSLVRTSTGSGEHSYFQMVQRSFFGVQLNRNLPHFPDGNERTLAAWIRREAGRESAEAAEAGEADGEQAKNEKEVPVNAIVVADLDFISDQFFQIRAQGLANLNFDNVSFFLNCLDVLAGDESFIALRNKRVHHRTLERVEEQTRQFVEARLAEQKAAEAEADKALAEAQSRLDARVDEVRQRTDLDNQTKQIMVNNLQEVENRRFEVLKANIEAEKEARIARSKERMEAQIRAIQRNIRTFAVLSPPIPVFVLGVIIFVRRWRREREGAAAAHRLRA